MNGPTFIEVQTEPRPSAGLSPNPPVLPSREHNSPIPNPQPNAQRPNSSRILIAAAKRLRDKEGAVEERAMASADLLRREEEFYSSLFDSAKGDGMKSRSQLIERKIEALEDMATKVSNRRSRRWLNDRLLIELVPRLHVEEIKGLFAPPPWGEEVPLSAFCRTSVGEWDAFRTIDMDAEAQLMQHMKQSSAKQKNHLDEDELIALNAWRRIDRQTRKAIKRNFLPDLLEIYEDRVRAFIEDTSDKDVLALNVQDPFQRLLLHGVCEFYNVTSTTTSCVRDGKPWKTTTIKKRSGTGVPSRITLVSFLMMKKNGTH